MFDELVEKLLGNKVYVSARRYRVVCAQSGGTWGIAGPSVWITCHRGRWILATWTPRVYVFKDRASIDLVASAITEIVKAPRKERLFAIDPGLQGKYGLSEVDVNLLEDLPEELD